MRFTPAHPPVLPGSPAEAVRLVSAWATRLFTDLSRLLNNGVLPEDQYDAFEVEVTFAAAPGSQVVDHPLLRDPVRVETVRTDQNGIVYVTATSANDVTVSTSAIGTYRLRIS